MVGCIRCQPEFDLIYWNWEKVGGLTSAGEECDQSKDKEVGTTGEIGNLVKLLRSASVLEWQTPSVLEYSVMGGGLTCNVQAIKNPIICHARVMSNVMVRLYSSMITCGAILSNPRSCTKG